MSGGTQTTTNSTQPANADVNATISKLAKGIGSLYDQGASYYDKPIYTGAGDTTKNAWSGMLGASNNGSFTQGINGSIDELGQIASGKRFGQLDPQYQKLRSNAMDDAVTAVGSGFTSSGRFGGGSYVDKAVESAGNVAAGMDLSRLAQDEARQFAAMDRLPGAFAASLAPSAARAQVGQMQDADTLAKNQDAYALWQRKYQAPMERLMQLTGAASGNAASGGQTSTQTSPAPNPWLGLLGMGLGFL